MLVLEILTKMGMVRYRLVRLILFALNCCINFLKENTMESIFAQAFMCLTYLAWTDDCLNDFFAHMKNDQASSERNLTHIYANPHNVLMLKSFKRRTFLKFDEV